MTHNLLFLPKYIKDATMVGFINHLTSYLQIPSHLLRCADQIPLVFLNVWSIFVFWWNDRPSELFQFVFSSKFYETLHSLGGFISVLSYQIMKLIILIWYINLKYLLNSEYCIWILLVKIHMALLLFCNPYNFRANA